MEKLGINLTSFFFQTINFLIIFFVLAKFVFPIIIKMLEERKQKIEEGIKNADKVKSELLHIEEKYKEELQKAQQEAKRIIENAKEETERIRKETIAKAQQEAQQILAKTQEEIKQKEKNALKNITSQAIQISMLVAENILKDKIGTINQTELIQRSLKEFDKAYE